VTPPPPSGPACYACATAPRVFSNYIYECCLRVKRRRTTDACVLQFQGAFLCIALGAGWAWSGVMRQRELDWQRRTKSRCAAPCAAATTTLSSLEAGLLSVQAKASSVGTVKVHLCGP